MDGDRIVEVQPAGIAKLHDRRCSDRLRDRRDPVERRGIRSPATRHVCEPDASRPGELVAVNDANRGARKALVLYEPRRLGLELLRDASDRTAHPARNLTN